MAAEFWPVNTMRPDTETRNRLIFGRGSVTVLNAGVFDDNLFRLGGHSQATHHIPARTAWLWPTCLSPLLLNS